MEYSHTALEKKWQKFWKENKVFVTSTNYSNVKSFVLDMFPYPSGKGLHVGHPKGYTASDVISRFKKMQGYNVLHPIGWDAFGLPAEQYALQTGKNPASFTEQNINTFRKQLQKLGFMYDYNKEVNTSHPNYFKITQYIFELLYKKGLAEQQEISVNWCPKLGTVLANEELVYEGEASFSERGHFPVIKKKMWQWVLKITHYADRLLKGLDKLNWPESVKKLQRNWIGKQEGYNLKLPIMGMNQELPVFVHNLSDLKQAEFIVIAFDSPLLEKLGLLAKKEIHTFIEKYQSWNDVMRANVTKEQFGHDTGLEVLNVYTNKRMPVWISTMVKNYLQNSVKLGNVFKEKIDYLFGRKYELSSFATSQKFLTLQNEKDHQEEDIKLLLQKHQINYAATVRFKLKDWLFARQRYWGEPIPVFFLADGSTDIIPESELPLVLPPYDSLDQHIKALTPLSKAKNWNQYYSQKHQAMTTLETSTMPQWAGSCWYYIAYVLTTSPNQMLNIKSPEAKKLLDYWLPVDIYIGGQEHAVLHLLYARFWHYVLYDAGLISCPEPFVMLINQGMITGTNGQKMSKSRGNVISVDDVIKSHGADALRLFHMFMGPIRDSLPWSYKGLDSMRKWLDRVYRMYQKYLCTNNKQAEQQLAYAYHYMVRSVTEKINVYHFNTAISAMMVFVNACYKQKAAPLKYMIEFCKILSVFSPHLAQELWFSLERSKQDVSQTTWPVYDPKVLEQSVIKIIIQVNGKTRSAIKTIRHIQEKELIEAIKRTDFWTKQQLAKKEIYKVIYIPNKVINFVVNN